jgi:hypothetical protein
VILKHINQEHLKSQGHEQKSQEHKQSDESINKVTNAQRQHQKVFVETYQNILSVDAAEDR